MDQKDKFSKDRATDENSVRNFKGDIWAQQNEIQQYRRVKKDRWKLRVLVWTDLTRARITEQFAIMDKAREAGPALKFFMKQAGFYRFHKRKNLSIAQEKSSLRHYPLQRKCRYTR